MEIDTNSQIIQLVQCRPVLYSKCSDFRTRSHQWKEVADILKVDVTWVRSRWHLLRSKFLMEYSSELKGKRSTFKYFNEMSFLVDHININAFEMHSKQSNQPEFVIARKDLDDGSDDDSSNTFIELELDDGANKELIQMHQTLDLTEDISETDLDEALYLPNEEISHSQQIVKTPKYEMDSQVETFHIVEVREKEDSATLFVKESPKNTVKQSDEHKADSSKLESSCPTEKEQHLEADALKPASESMQTKKACNSKSEKHRCEDTIFGELVTATLRKMPNEKKKSVKREIMNILFT